VIDFLGWICTALILAGYILNSNQKTKYALAAWIVGDIGWILYDFRINNPSHATLSVAIILINLYGVYKLYKK
jgi:hypothetical protein